MTVLDVIKPVVDREPGFVLQPNGAKGFVINYTHPTLGLLLCEFTFQSKQKAKLAISDLGITETVRIDWTARKPETKALAVAGLIEKMKNPSGFLAVHHGEALTLADQARQEYDVTEHRVRQLTRALERLR